MKKFLVLIPLAFTVNLHAQWRIDKLDNNTLIHLSVGMGIGNAAGIFGNTPKQRILFGAVSGATVGMAKEIYDTRNKNQYAQVHDVISTTVGGVIGALMVNWAVKRHDKYKETRMYRYRKCKM